MDGVTTNNLDTLVSITLRHVTPRYTGLIFQQDNAGGHQAQFTLNIMQQYRFQPIYWPSNSPDFNRIKSRIISKINYPDIHRNYRQLRATIAEAWEAISDSTVRDVIKTMPARYQAVVDAQGGETIY
jgi:hypothetical protein